MCVIQNFIAYFRIKFCKSAFSYFNIVLWFQVAAKSQYMSLKLKNYSNDFLFNLSNTRGIKILMECGNEFQTDSGCMI